MAILPGLNMLTQLGAKIIGHSSIHYLLSDFQLWRLSVKNLHIKYTWVPIIKWPKYDSVLCKFNVWSRAPVQYKDDILPV